MKAKERLIERVVRILMRDEFRYILMVSLPNSKEEIGLEFLELDKLPRFFADVPRGKPMWVLERVTSYTLSEEATAEIHIHSAEDVSGAEWSRPVGRGGIATGSTDPL